MQLFIYQLQSALLSATVYNVVKFFQFVVESESSGFAKRQLSELPEELCFSSRWSCFAVRAVYVEKFDSSSKREEAFHVLQLRSTASLRSEGTFPRDDLHTPSTRLGYVRTYMLAVGVGINSGVTNRYYALMLRLYTSLDNSGRKLFWEMGDTGWISNLAGNIARKNLSAVI